MPLPHYIKKPFLVGKCKYCGESVYGMEEWRIQLTNWMGDHIEKNKCKSKFREERLKNILD